MLRNKIYVKVLCTVLALFLVFGLTAQNPYELNYKRDIPILFIGVGGQTAAIYIFATANGLSEEEVSDLDKNDINKFDRPATGYNSAAARTTSDILLASSIALPIALLANKNIRNGYLEVGVMAAEAFLINGITTSFTKELATRARPFAYNPDIDLEEKTKFRARLSFYSGHTSSTSAMFYFSAKVFSDYYPESKWKPLVWSVAAIAPAVTGYMRVRGGEHFPTDVITGYLAGGIIGYLIPHLHRKKDKDQKVGFRLHPGINSFGMTMTW